MDNWVLGFQSLSMMALIWVVIGTAIGIFIGAMPGLNATAGLALVLPFTFSMEPAEGLILLTAVYVGAEYGGSISAILIATPGTPAAVATVFDGYPLTRQGKAGKAIGMSLYAGTVGMIICSITLVLIAVPLSKVALSFGPPEFLALGILGLTLVASLSTGAVLKGVLGCLIGLLLATVGTDTFTGFSRFDFGVTDLRGGMPLVPLMLGVFAISEALVMLGAGAHSVTARTDTAAARELPNRKEVRASVPAMLRGSVIGNVVGVVPGAGAAIASLIAYNEERRFSRTPERFGTGHLPGVAAPEAANNAVVGGALVPLLTLGLPGSASTAVMLSVLMIHGINPGPELFTDNAEVVYALFVALPLITLAQLLLGLLLGVRVWTQVLRVPRLLLASIIIALCVVASYAEGNVLSNVWVVVLSGLIAYVLRRNGFPLAPIVLGLVLGFMMESNLRRGLLMSQGDPMIFLSSPVAIAMLALSAVSLVVPLWRYLRSLGRAAPREEEPADHLAE